VRAEHPVHLLLDLGQLRTPGMLFCRHRRPTFHKCTHLAPPGRPQALLDRGIRQEALPASEAMKKVERRVARA
jgi:hypothetical protein